MAKPTRIAVIGGGITGAAAAFELSSRLTSGELDHVALFERDDAVGGRMLTSPFAGLDHVDCGPDAFLARVPDAVRLATEVGIGDELVHPEKVGAAVWVDRLHPIPAGLVLGVPGNPIPLAKSGLLTWKGKARAALEPFLPRTSTEADSIGAYVRARFGDEVHERLVDALVGSIYATDTDRFSLTEMPQVASLTTGRSMLLTARKVARATAGTATAAAAPIFATPRRGTQALVHATVQRCVEAGVELHTGNDAILERRDRDWLVNGSAFDAVIVATPAGAARTLLEGVAASTCDALASAETADVALVSLHLDSSEFPDQLAGMSGYLVPKPVQRDVTAVSFGSQKWNHWRPPGGGEILRVSMGRDGAPVLHLDDDEIVERILADLDRQLGVSFSPSDVRVSRWAGAFAQYRPHHRSWVDSVRATLPDGVFVAGSSYDGIGLPACIRSGRTIAERAVAGTAPVSS